MCSLKFCFVRRRVQLLCVAKQRDSAENPVVRILDGLEQKRKDVREISASRFLVDGTLVQAHVPFPFACHREYVNDGQRRIEDLRSRFHESAITPVPSSAVQEESVNIDSFVNEEKHLKIRQTFMANVNVTKKVY